MCEDVIAINYPLRCTTAIHSKGLC